MRGNAKIARELHDALPSGLGGEHRDFGGVIVRDALCSGGARPLVVFVSDGHARLVGRRETYADLCAGTWCVIAEEPQTIRDMDRMSRTIV